MVTRRIPERPASKGVICLNKFKSGIDKVMKAIENLLWIMLAAAVIIVVMQIVSRYVVGNSLIWTEQAARYLFIWMVMLGVPIMFHKKIFISFDLISKSFPKKVQEILNIVIIVACIAFSCYYFYHSLQLVIQTMGRYTSGFRVPFWLLYGAQPVFCVLLFFVEIGLLIDQITEMRTNGGSETGKGESE